MTCKPCCVKAVVLESSCSSEQETVATPEGYDLPSRFVLVPRQAVLRGRKATVPASKHVVQVQGRGAARQIRERDMLLHLGQAALCPHDPASPLTPQKGCTVGLLPAVSVQHLPPQGPTRLRPTGRDCIGF